MDTGTGKMIPIDLSETMDEKSLHKKYPSAKSIFFIGEELKIKNSFFRVKEITPFGIRLKLLKEK